MTTVRQLAAKDLDQHWNTIGPMLNQVLIKSKCNDYTIVDVYNATKSGAWSVYIAEEKDRITGVATVIFQQYPRDIVAYIPALSGRLVTNKETSGKFFDLLKARGAARVQGASRPSVARLWRCIGLQEKYAIVEGQL